MNTSRRMSNDQRYFQSYDQFQVHELMLRDRPRVSAYHDAMMNNKHLFENKVVLDVGSGTGILSMFAAKAGAKLVYAVDACPKICDVAKDLIKHNHLQDRVHVINKRVEDIEKFDENIDIIISEWMGFYLFHESMLESVIYARDHFLRTSEQDDSTLIFPSHAYLYCAPFVDENIRIDQNSMWKNYFDLNFTPILPHIPNSDLNQCVIETIEPSQLVHHPQLIQSINLRTIQIDELHSMHSFCEFSIDNTCIISGFCFWFDCYFSSNTNSTVLSTSPYSPKTHWKQTLVFLPEDIYPLKEDTVPVDIKLKQSSENQRQYNLTISIQDTLVNENITSDNQSMDSENSESDNESNESDEHPIPCSCDRNKCKLIRTIMEKYDEENIDE